MNYLKKTTRFLVLILLVSVSINAQVKLPRFISNGMVLQRNTSIPVWGWALAGEKIEVNFNGKTYKAVAGKNKRWTVHLDKMKEGGPYKMQIKGFNKILINDILIGDVWICSGQSNMEFRMNMYIANDKYGDVIANSTNSFIRQFLVDKKYNFSSQLEDIASGEWKSANPESVLQFTAVGYFFAKSLYEKYKVPIGLIHSSWGGTPAEAWISEESLKSFPNYYNQLLGLKDSLKIKQVIASENIIKNDWYNLLKNTDKGLADSNNKWFDINYDASAWSSFKLPGFTEEKGMKNSGGIIWFRKEINVSKEMASQRAKLLLGYIADEDSTYINGVKVGATNNIYTPRIYELPVGILKSGKNILVVRVINKSGNAGFLWNKKYRLTAVGDTLNLEGAWRYKAGVIASKPLPGSTGFHYKPAGLYNAMISPLIPYAIKGVIWYQGESNAGRALEYRSLFPNLIRDWRKQWAIGDFPFLFVQLANMNPSKKQPDESSWAELREAQSFSLSVPETGMAVSVDIGEWNDIHPLNKDDVGKRLALAARKVAYKEKGIVYSGPIYQSMKIRGRQIILSFKNKGGGLIAKNDSLLKHFAIAGVDKKFVWANAIIKNNQVVVWNKAIENPVAVRYAWADNPEGANLYNKEGLPASPFRTDF